MTRGVALVVAASLLLCSLFAGAVNYHPVHSSGTPTVSSCGTSPSVAGTDGVGVITTGSGTVTTCTLNFSATLQAAPSCVVVTSATSVTPAVTSASNAAVVVGLSSTLTSGKIYYRCLYLVGTYDPLIQWSASMESGTLLTTDTPAGEWSEQVVTFNAVTTAVTAASVSIPAKVGSFVMKQQWTADSGQPEASGTRMSRYTEINALTKAGTTFWYSWWDYFPAALSYTSTGFYNHWQIASNDGLPSSADPIWVLGIANSGMTMTLDWSPNNKAPANGPHSGESGPRTYTSSVVIPTAQWVRFEVMITPREDFTGALKIFMNNQVLFDLSLIKTQFPFNGQSLFTWIANNDYGLHLSPAPFIHYVDYVTVSLLRMP